MNRQARVVGSEWQNMGNVSLEDAAVGMFERANLASDTLKVEVRDEDNEEVSWILTVQSMRYFRVTGLRGVDEVVV